MNFNLKSSFKKIAAVAAGVAVAAANPAYAGAVDVTATVSDIGAQLAPIGLIGVAVLGVFVAVKAFHWVRGALR